MAGGIHCGLWAHRIKRHYGNEKLIKHLKEAPRQGFYPRPPPPGKRNSPMNPGLEPQKKFLKLTPLKLSFRRRYVSYAPGLSKRSARLRQPRAKASRATAAYLSFQVKVKILFCVHTCGTPASAGCGIKLSSATAFGRHLRATDMKSFLKTPLSPTTTPEKTLGSDEARVPPAAVDVAGLQPPDPASLHLKSLPFGGQTSDGVWRTIRVFGRMKTLRLHSVRVCFSIPNNGCSFPKNG